MWQRTFSVFGTTGLLGTPGLKVGWLIADENHIKTLATFMSYNFFSTSTTGQVSPARLVLISSTRSRITSPLWPPIQASSTLNWNPRTKPIASFWNPDKSVWNHGRLGLWWATFTFRVGRKSPWPKILTYLNKS